MNRNKSVCSRGSQRSRRSTVDETLFGANKENKALNNSAFAQPTISLKELREIRGKAEKSAQPDAAFISKRDLERIKEHTRIQTKAQKLAQQRIIDEQRGQQMAQSKARKQKMIAMDRDKTRFPPINNLKDQSIKTETMLTKAQDQIDEEQDDVKHMNQMLLYTKIATIREKQLDENTQLEQEWVQEQKRLDLMMEIERLKNCQAEQEREEKKRHARAQGARVIVDQIKERDIERIKEEELREKERLQLLTNIENQKKYELKQSDERKQRVKILMAQVAEANQAAISLREQRKQEEKDLENKIHDYQKAKIQKEEENLREQQRLREEKERETQRLRELQEKAQDRQAELDALKAQKVHEANEKVVSTKARIAQEKKQKVMNELEEARQVQFKDKETRLAQNAKHERDEFLSIINKQRQEEETERRLAEERKNIFKIHQECVQAQIVNNTDTRKQHRVDYLEEGKKSNKVVDDERVKIMEIKKRKIESLQGLDIPDKYKNDLLKKKVSF